MTKFSALFLGLTLAGCNTRQPQIAQIELCGMPWGLRGWSGITIRASGIVGGGPEHGFFLSGEHCLKGGRLYVADDAVNGDRLNQRLLSIGVKPGITRIDVEARIERDDDDGPVLRVTRYFGGSFQPMTERQEQSYFDKRYP